MNKKIWIVLLFLCGLNTSAMAEDVDANNVVIVLDASGSMEEQMSQGSMKKMDAAKNALIEVLKTIAPGTQVGLLVFSAGNLADDWAYLLGPLDPARLERAIRMPIPYGRTPLGEYIKKGADRLLEERARQFGYGTYRLLVVTDGEAQDQDLVDRYVPEAMARGITLDVIGVGMNTAHTLATKVHSYRSADNPESLTRALIEVFAEVGGTGSDAAGEETFAELEAIPYDMAQAMLKALAVSGNQPLGQSGLDKPLIDPADRTAASPAPAAPAQPSPQPAEEETRSFINWILLAFIAAIVFIMMRKKKKRR